MPYVDPDSLHAHVRHGIKTALATILALVAAKALGLHFGYWAALSAVIVMQVSVADSVQMGWYRVTGTAIGAAMGVVAITAVPDTEIMNSAALFLAVGVCAFMTRYNSRYRMAAITATIVIMASTGQPDRVVYGLERVVEIAIGVGCAFAVSVLLWPLKATTALRRRLEAHFGQSADYYSMLVESYLDRQTPLSPHLLDVFSKAVHANRAQWRQARRHEGLIYRDATRDIDDRIDILERCAQHMRSMLRSLDDVQGEAGFDVIMAAELREIAQAVVQAMDAVAEGGTPSTQRLRAALEAADKRLADLRGQGVTRRLSLARLMQFFSFFHAMRSIARDVVRLTSPDRLDAMPPPAPGPGAPNDSDSADRP